MEDRWDAVPEYDDVTTRHATSRHVMYDVTPRHDVMRKKIGVNRQNIYYTLQLVLASTVRIGVMQRGSTLHIVGRGRQRTGIVPRYFAAFVL